MKGNKGNATSVVLVIIGILIVGGWMFLGRTPLEQNSTFTASSTPSASESFMKINGKIVSLIVADTIEERELGLGGRVSLGENEAMIFVFDIPAQYEFWMKDMKFPIDIIWLDEKFKVVHIESNVTPETYPDEVFVPEENSLYVIETAALFAEKNNLKIGDTVEVSLKK
jgi:uncharacterized membrane protein (UPF0127 family)